mmetsp:Transcript_27940/g.42803  ORF Transcript_27940/g.42803 Transcript_27940/m.42803 type:complete len:125 (+) Transcript_27940:362-736(+)
MIEGIVLPHVNVLWHPYVPNHLSCRPLHSHCSHSHYSHNYNHNHIDHPNNNHNHNNDVTDIIQFASGMELLDPQQDDDTGTLVMAYGINDCEAAFLPLQMKDVQQMLRKVPEGTQVVDVMKPFQ